MKVFVKGQGPVVLGQAEFVAQGGQASVYARGDVAFKLFTDPDAMVPAGKIAELALLADPFVIKPEALVLDARRKAIGYTMRYVPGCRPLCQLVPPAFRQRHRVGHDRVLELVRALQQRIGGVHAAGALVVDVNEMNFLVGADLATLWAIDADSYQTPSYPATAFTPSTRDPYTLESHDFTELSDWFSFAVLAFSLWIGVHPFRGKHPTVKTVSERMRRHLSVMAPDVTLPKVAYPLDVIPGAYRDWLHAVLQEGKRLRPPSDASPAPAIASRAPFAATALTMKHLATAPAPIRDVLFSDGGELWLLTDQGLYDLHGRRLDDASGQRLAPSFPSGAAVTVAFDGDVELRDTRNRRSLEPPLSARAIAGYRGGLLALGEDAVLALVLRDVGTSVVASARLVTRVLPRASQLFEGLVVQSLLGATYLSLIDASLHCHQLRVAELDGCQVIDAKHDRGVAMLLVSDGQAYHRVLLRRDGAGYQLDWARDVGPSAIDFVTLDRAVVVSRDEHGSVEIRDAKPTARVRRIEDPLPLGGWLAGHAGQVFFVNEDTVYRLSTK